MKFPYKRKNHLKSKLIIDQLFSTGKVITKPPFRLIYLNVENSEFTGVQTLISIPKRRFKLAVSRNSIKRKVAEAFRLNATEMNQLIESKNMHLALGFIYIGNRELDFSEGEKKIVTLLTELGDKFKEVKNEE